jgi:hypothetical protein
MKLEQAFTSIPSEPDDHLSLNLKCIDPADSSKQIHGQINSFGFKFDLIVINQALLRLTFEQLRSFFGAAMDSVSQEPGGSVLISGMLPHHSMHQDELDPFRLLLHMRSYGGCDAALSLSEGGLLLVIPRRNPYLFSVQVLESLNYDYAQYRQRMDRFIPVLSLAEVHIWLSTDTATTRYVRGVHETSKEDYDKRRQFFQEQYNISIDDMLAPR